MTAKQRYIDSVGGVAHQSAVEIIEELEESRDELLEFLQDISNRVGDDYSWEFVPVIQKVEALKEKANE